MKFTNVSTVMGYGLSGLMGIIGILVLSGILTKEGTPAHLRILFGVVLIVYSIYRFTITRTRRRQEEGSEE